MQSQYESLQMEYQKQSFELKERSDRASLDQGSLEDLQKLLDSERSRVDELQVSLNETESERDQLNEQVETLENKNKEFSKLVTYNENLKTEVAELKKKNEFLFEEIAKERLRLESKIEILSEDLDSKKKEYSIKEFEVVQLLKENSDLTSYKRQVLTLEQEKRDLEAELVTAVAESRMVAEARTRSAKSPSPATTVDSSAAGDDGLKMQIDFLNSVIVDMQKKNDKLSAQLEVYETAGILGNLTSFETCCPVLP